MKTLSAKISTVVDVKKYADVDVIYDGGYGDNYDWIYEQGFIIDDEELEGVSDGTEVGEDEEIIEEGDITLECPSSDIGMA